MYGGVRGVPGNRAPISIGRVIRRCEFKSKNRRQINANAFISLTSVSGQRVSSRYPYYEDGILGAEQSDVTMSTKILLPML